MLSPIDRKGNPCDIFCLREIEHGGRNIVGPWTMLKRQTLGLRDELDLGLARTRKSRPRRYRIDPNSWCQRLRQCRGRRMERCLA